MTHRAVEIVLGRLVTVEALHRFARALDPGLQRAAV